MNWPKISIVTPSFNQGKYLEKTILSVIEQGYPNLEYIIIDGGSRDESVEIIRKYEKHLTYWVSEPDRGQSHAINKGFERATGEIFGWLNSDDWYHPGALKTIAETFAANPEAGAVVGGGDFVDEAGNTIVRTIPGKVTLDTLYSWFDDYFWQPSCFFSRQAWESAGCLDESLHLSMDYDLWLRIASKFTFVTTDVVLSTSLKHAEAKTTAHLHESDHLTLKLVLRHGGERAFDSILSSYARRLTQFDEGSSQQIAHLNQTVMQLHDEVSKYKKEIRRLNSQLSLTTIQLQKTEESLSQLSKEKEVLLNSVSWKITSPIRNILDKMKGARATVNNTSVNQSIELFPMGTGRITPISFAKHDRPLVSIVIPVHNQFAYTWSCLLSIHKNTSDIAYEIIIADDASTDRTQNLRRYAKNITVIRNDPNLGFLRNCNNAAKEAKGRYLVFLNNDTNVQADWLRYLKEVVENDNTVGIVGAKLVFPDGTLQEAGGIVWNDGTAANYGRDDDPTKPEYNYLKECDYVSGACLLILRELWERIGGFDERFVPAYCEDTDLAFMVRQSGYKVVYQPKAVAIHFEGKSHGTDLDKGVKQYQVHNQSKFKEKWLALLKEQNESPGNYFNARDRSGLKKTVLFVDYEVPHYDMFAGSRTSAMYLKLLNEMGYNVKLLPADFRNDEPYTSHFEQMGIEVLYGKSNRDCWQTWFFDNNDKIHAVYFNKPDPTSLFIDFVRDVTDARIIYYGHDLHYVRLMRKYELDGDEETLEESHRYKKLENAIFEKTDVIMTISEEERELISGLFPCKKTVLFPAFCYSEFPEVHYRFSERKGIMFVGGFGHVPNVDGIIWFVREVFPIVIKRIPDIVMSIAGSSPPPEVYALASPSLKVLGQLSDQALDALYDSSRVVVIPLRYGAGVKGKTIEAIYKGVPFASTSIGIEGIKGVERFAVGTDDPEEFAEEICRIYTDEQLYRSRYEMLCSYARSNLSTARAKGIFSEILS